MCDWGGRDLLGMRAGWNPLSTDVEISYDLRCDFYIRNNPKHVVGAGVKFVGPAFHFLLLDFTFSLGLCL